MDLINLDILQIGRRWNLASPQATPELEVVAESSLAGDGTGQASAPRIQETPEIEQIARFFRSDDSAEQASAAAIQETLKIEELAPFFLAGDSAEQASAAAIQETLKIEELAPFFLAGDRAEQASAAPIHETPEAEAIAPSPIAGDTGEQTSLPVIQGRPLLKKASQPFVVRHAEEEPLQPSLLSFYGLCEQPFGVTPDPAYLYFSPAHHEALKSISRGIQDDRD